MMVSYLLCCWNHFDANLNLLFQVKVLVLLVTLLLSCHTTPKFQAQLKPFYKFGEFHLDESSVTTSAQSYNEQGSKENMLDLTKLVELAKQRLNNLLRKGNGRKWRNAVSLADKDPKSSSIWKWMECSLFSLSNGLEDSQYL